MAAAKPAKSPPKSPTKSPGKSPPRRGPGAGSRAKLKKWSGKVTRHSDALDLENGVFKKRSARDIALSLKRSAESSRRRKPPPLRSVISMLAFSINRAGKSLSTSRRRTLEAAKDELHKLFKTKTAA